MAVIKMDFHYYFIIQDVAGVLIAALAFKLILLYVAKVLKKGLSSKYTFCILGNIMLLLSGVNLVISPFGIKAWILSILLLVTGYELGKFTYKNYS